MISRKHKKSINEIKITTDAAFGDKTLTKTAIYIIKKINPVFSGT
jgi:hypothetical protein